VINATGVILHTNLGRAPLAAFANTAGYSNLELDLATGKRGKRDSHFAPLLEELLGVSAIAVNNNAAATFLVLKALAEGQEVIVSRGELVEIGDGFRIPDIMAQSGARLREVGATNRTHLADYERAIDGNTRLLMRVHPSNFHQTGFVGKPTLRELASLARERNLPLYEDLGSGCLVDLRPYGVTEPLVSDSLDAGVDIVSFSCDKLLGGPQAGIIAGRADLVQRIRRHPLYRALRLDKLAVEALSNALRALLLQQYDALPALRMLRSSAAEIHQRATQLAQRIPGAQVIPGRGLLGGGSTPDQSLDTALIALAGNATQWEKQLRAANPPVVARIEDGQLLLDLRTVFPEDEPLLLAALGV
jgi:L-seryl-tRNA(Ser) seleniumtransferase